MSGTKRAGAWLLWLFLSLAPAAFSGEEGPAPGRAGGDTGIDAETAATSDAVTGATTDADTGATPAAENVDLDGEIGDYDLFPE